MTAQPLTSTKVRKFPCDACGADLRYDPGLTALQCPYCGATKTIAPSLTSVTEKPVDAALRAPRNVGWGAERKVMACQRCGAHTTLEPNISASNCAFCGTAAVVEAPPAETFARPEGLLAFRVPKDNAIQTFRRWLKGLWFRPNDLKSKSRVTSIQGVYIPFWTFDAVTHSHWQAEAGYHYYVTSGGKREQRTRWESASGSLTKDFDDVPVPASRGIDQSLAQTIEPFPTNELAQYEPSYLSGFLAEENAIDLPEALESAKDRMRDEIRSACAREVPGDTHRNLTVQSVFSALAYKNCLLPIWIAAYEYRSKPYRYIVNGVTGRASGTAPWSWVKLTFLGLTILTIVLIILSNQ
ncbi:MAG TPA: zinc ribbon domain-containing protein [Thermoanaerobaculia bacterium]|nr:zinc ribbon domain-containing protein [Thermoanaerobaculia bacterium]